MRRAVWMGLASGVAALALAGASVAQQGQDDAQAAAPDELVFEREVFDYPTFQRRNPFVPLLSTAEGPRFEQLRLRGLIYDRDPDRSMALMGPVSGGPGRRLHVGESWGNVRVVEIRRSEVIVEVEEFGQIEQRVMTLQNRGQGGS